MESNHTAFGHLNDSHEFNFSGGRFGDSKRNSLTRSLPHRVAYLDPEEAGTIATLVRHLSSDSLHSDKQNDTQLVSANSSDTESDDEVEYEVSEEFVTKFNNNLGNKKLLYTANNLLYRTRILGGLERGNPSEAPYINIPAARKNFAILASLKDKDLKMIALSNLHEMLQQHDYSGHNADGLIDLTILVMNRMNPELMQTETLPVQKKICQIYGLIAEMVLAHYEFKDLNGVTTKLKDELISTAKTLEVLNTQDDLALHFECLYALEGIKRLKDNRKNLFMVGETLYRVIMAGVSAFMTDGSALTYNLDEAYKVGKKIPRGFKHSWYDQVLLFNRFFLNLTASIHQQNAAKKLKILQYVVEQHYKDTDWKYLFNALTAYANLAIHSPDAEVRMGALKGMDSESLHGLEYFMKTNCYKIAHDKRPIFRSKKPIERDRNMDIQKYCGHLLLKIARMAEDPDVRREAKQLLYVASRDDTYSKELRAYINDRIPKTKELCEQWIAEEGHYVWRKPSDPSKVVLKRLNRVSKDPQQPIAVQMVTGQTPDGKSQPLIIITTPYGAAAPTTLNPPNAVERPMGRPPSKVLNRLSVCLGTPPARLSEDFIFDGSVRPRTGEGLHIGAEGLSHIHEYLMKHTEIHRLDFRNVLWEDGSLAPLKVIAELGSVHEIELDNLITEEEAKMFAQALAKNPSLRFVLSNSESCLLLGQALREKGLVDDSIFYLKQGLLPSELEEVDKGMKAKIFKNLGIAYELNGESKHAALAYEKALNYDPLAHDVEKKINTLKKRSKNSEAEALKK